MLGSLIESWLVSESWLVVRDTKKHDHRSPLGAQAARWYHRQFHTYVWPRNWKSDSRKIRFFSQKGLHFLNCRSIASKLIYHFINELI